MLVVQSYSLHESVGDDRLVVPPGYPNTYLPDVFAGYLNTSSPLRKLHYIFMHSINGENNTDPVTLWMNGGPGCASKLGFIQEIAPYFLELNTPYSEGDKLTRNPYSWTNLSNLLFVDSPAGVGFSINNDQDYKYNDTAAAKDMLDALVYFFQTKQPTFANRSFYIAGESYAGKYIPDLAELIYKHNVDSPDTAISLKGILVGNGVMSFENGELEKSEIDYMVERDFIDPELLHYWTDSCRNDEESAGCQYFYTRFLDLTGDINPYNVYGYCYPDVLSQKGKHRSSQRSLMRRAASFRIPRNHSYGDGDCEYDHGLQTYFDVNAHIWNSQTSVPFAACNDTIFEAYDREPRGSLDAYRSIINRGQIKVYLYNGDWDDVVPFRDTIKNLQLLDLQPRGDYQPWKIDDQHAGFIREYPGLLFWIVKGAGHEVPQYQRQRAYELFKSFLKA